MEIENEERLRELETMLAQKEAALNKTAKELRKEVITVSFKENEEKKSRTNDAQFVSTLRREVNDRDQERYIVSRESSMSRVRENIFNDDFGDTGGESVVLNEELRSLNDDIEKLKHRIKCENVNIY